MGVRVTGEARRLVDPVRLLPVERVGREPRVFHILIHSKWLRSEILDIEILVRPGVRY